MDSRDHCGWHYFGKVNYFVRDGRYPHLHYEDHLLLELPILVVLRADLPVEMQELLEGLVLRRQHVLDYGHQERGLHSATYCPLNPVSKWLRRRT